MMTIDDMLSQVAKITGKALNDRPGTQAVKTVSTQKEKVVNESVKQPPEGVTYK